MKKQIYLKESELNRLIYESVKTMLTESQESKSQSEAIKLVMSKLNYNFEQANEFVRVTLRGDLPALRDKTIAKFTLGAARMLCDGNVRDAGSIADLNATLKLLSAHVNEYDRNLNGLSAQELIHKFEKVRQDNLEGERSEIDAMEFGQSNYQIVSINSFAEAKQYYKYTNPNSRWCLTHMNDQYNSYTCDGINQIYFCLRNGFEHVRPIVGENAPLDDYGLSMISVIVNERGELAFCTTRWNHENGGNDSVMTAKELSQVVGVNFYQVFKPNNKWNELLTAVRQRLANGEDPKNIFDYVGDFEGNYAEVELNRKYNFIDQNGDLLSQQWFDFVGDFEGNYAVVELNGTWNVINQNGELVSQQGFDDAWNFSGNYARVKLDGRYNFIDQNGGLLSQQWFDDAGNFKGNYAAVKLDGRYNFLNQNGGLLSQQGFDGVGDFSENYARVVLSNKWNFINQHGELLSQQWFDFVGDFSGNYARVKLDGTWNFINPNADFLSQQWFDYVEDFSENYAIVKLDDKYNFLNQHGDLLLQQWLDGAGNFKGNYAMVKLKRKYNFLDQNGGLLSQQWFDSARNFNGDYAMVKLDGKWYDINRNGDLLSQE